MYNIKQINTGVAELLAVKVPDGAKSFTTISKYLYFYALSSVYSSIEIPPGNLKPLGIDAELTQEQCREVVKSGTAWFGSYKNYVTGTMQSITAKKAFASLMQANGIDEPHLILKRLS